MEKVTLKNYIQFSPVFSEILIIRPQSILLLNITLARSEIEKQTDKHHVTIYKDYTEVNTHLIMYLSPFKISIHECMYVYPRIGIGI